MKSLSIGQIIYYLGNFIAIIGGFAAVIGLLMFIGNITGIYSSFPYAGGITLFVGSIIFSLGNLIKSWGVKFLLSDERYKTALNMLAEENANMERVLSYLSDKDIPPERAKRDIRLIFLAIQDAYQSN